MPEATKQTLVSKNSGKYTVEVKSRVAPGAEVSPSDASTPQNGEAKGSSTGSTGYHPGKLDIYFLGITLVISGQYFSWNLGLAAGLYSYLIIYVVMGLAYITFCCCMSEVTSALPFAGGAYGLARCTLGFFPAYLIGCCEAVEYIASVSVIVLALADLFVLMVPTLDGVKPLIWLAFYVSSVTLQIRGHGAFWITSLVIGALSLLILLVYCFGVLGDVDFNANALSDPSQLYIGGFNSAMGVLPYSAWFFLGIEALNLASDDVKKPKTQIPVAQVACICTLFVTGLFTFLVTVSLPMEGGVGAIAGVLAPLNNGFMRLLNVNVPIATLLTIPSQYAAAYGLSWAHSKLIHGMAESRLLPPILASTTQRYRTPYLASLVGAVLGYGICLAVYFHPPIAGYLLPVCLLFAFSSYAGQCIGYISLRTNYPLVKQRTFRNPFGIAGAVYSLTVWIVSIVAIFGFQPGNEQGLILFCVTLVVLSVYYVLFAKKRQIMSEEESKVLLKAHILKFNSKRGKSSSGRSIRENKSRLSRMLSSITGTKPSSRTSGQTAGRS